MDAAARIAVRPAIPDDAPALARINRRARSAAMPGLGEVHSEAAVEAWLRRYLIPREQVLCAGGAELLDGPGLGREAQGWSVHDLYIDPAAQGGAAMEAMGDAPLRLSCSARNQAARGFYERHGFRVEAKGDRTQNEEGEPDVLYLRLPMQHMRGTQP